METANKRPTLLKIFPYQKDGQPTGYIYGNERNWIVEMNNDRRSTDLTGDEVSQRLFARSEVDFFKLLLDKIPNAAITTYVSTDEKRHCFSSFKEAKETFPELEVGNNKHFACMTSNGMLWFESWNVEKILGT